MALGSVNREGESKMPEPNRKKAVCCECGEEKHQLKDGRWPGRWIPIREDDGKYGKHAVIDWKFMCWSCADFEKPHDYQKEHRDRYHDDADGFGWRRY